MSKSAIGRTRRKDNSGDADTVRQLLALVKHVHSIATRAVAIAQEAIEASNLLAKREAEAAEIIRELLRTIEYTDGLALIHELRPKAKAFLAAKKKARNARSKADAAVWEALLDEINAGTPKRARAKRIALKLGKTPQHVLEVIARLRKSTWPNDF